LPPPGRQTVDIGCGEGRLARDLKELGHHIVGIDSSPSLIAAAREFDSSIDFRLADAAALPLEDASVDLAVAFMSLQDIDDLPAAVRESARVLEPGGRLCLAIVHPINSAGRFEQASVAGDFVIEGDYLRAFQYADRVERDGLMMTFHSQHRPLQAYFLALEKAGSWLKRFASRAFRNTPLSRKLTAAGSAYLFSCTYARFAHKGRRRESGGLRRLFKTETAGTVLLCYYSATPCEHSMVEIILLPTYLTEVILSLLWTISAMR